MNDILDALEIIGNNNSDLNHIFINFSPVFPLQPPEVEQALGGFLERFGRRLWRLRVTGAEIRIVCTDPTTGMPYPLRVVITNTSGYVIQVEMYAERKSEKGGDWVFQSIGGTTKIGSMHLRPVSTPYPTKEWLQPKRYKAHLMGTQYVYDFPELFRQAIQNSWVKAVKKHSSLATSNLQPANVLTTASWSWMIKTTLLKSSVSQEPIVTVWLDGSSLHELPSILVAVNLSSSPTTSLSRLVVSDPRKINSSQVHGACEKAWYPSNLPFCQLWCSHRHG
jgi:hypothetical protein